jgi:adenosylhomocysteine nucleosidase
MIGIIGAMDHEISVIKEGMNIQAEEEILGGIYYIGTIGNNDVVLTKCGVGKVNAAISATVLINTYECDFIINTGIAGGFPGLSTRDVIIGSKLLYSDVDVTAFGYKLGQIPGMPLYLCPSIDTIVKVKKTLQSIGTAYKEGTIYTGDKFVTSLEHLSQFEQKTNVACEMEGGAIAHVCVKARVDFIVLRYISDIVGEESQVNDYQAFEFDMANQSAKICLELVHNL